MEYNFNRYFTVAEANHTLPLVKKIVGDILDLSHEIRSLVLILGDDIDEHPQLNALSEQLNVHFAELAEMGCFYKDWNFSIGLVDFPATFDGKEVFLCWRSDEDSIRYYHDIHAGFAGRKPIPERYLSE